MSYNIDIDGAQQQDRDVLIPEGDKKARKLQHVDYDNKLYRVRNTYYIPAYLAVVVKRLEKFKFGECALTIRILYAICLIMFDLVHK